MISRTHAKKEIGRLSACNFFPARQPQALSELIDALQLGSKSNEHATLVVNEALGTSTACPTPADLKKLCSEVGKKSEGWPPPCTMCAIEGGNWRRSRVLRAGREAEVMTRCTCARGRLLLDRENAERRSEGREEVKPVYGVTFIDAHDADLADLHGMPLLGRES